MNKQKLLRAFILMENMEKSSKGQENERHFVII